VCGRPPARDESNIKKGTSKMVLGQGEIKMVLRGIKIKLQFGFGYNFKK
jgi:hypothetical protein